MFCVNFHAGTQIKHLKHRIDTIDEENLTYSYTVIEGGDLLDKIESVSYEIKFEPTPDGGCKGKNVSKYYPKPGVQINEEEIKAGKEKAMAVYKAVEAYLVANPNAYNWCSFLPHYLASIMHDLLPKIVS